MSSVTLICDEAGSAKRVTFSKDVGVWSITLEGGVYDPSGTLSAEWKREVLEQEEEKSKRPRGEWKALTRDLEMKVHELKLLKEQVEGSNAARIGTQVEELKQGINDLESAI
ncbi:hypothetical protein M378DRAFT_14866 [Amanita muscaria Koide BX008]|uniref:Uncharacterized protein n=1 Tax=Amanita muscaria (strain Koide BX008) TaxID=946122 RepID=A0A0C2WDA8_AMAMK|nr:hypothetical protein M378DRAFT_14866 [Amanita muscaria Koide BX008]